jgi:hypothetical protein
MMKNEKHPGFDSKAELCGKKTALSQWLQHNFALTTHQQLRGEDREIQTLCSVHRDFC